jgi:preprotein translocase subunit SecD
MRFLRKWGYWLLLGFILITTAFSVATVWPSEPDRYLPDFVPWPQGKGIKFPWFKIEGGEISGVLLDRRAMRLGLDLQGGTRLVLQADTSGIEEGSISDALDGAIKVLERRVNAFGLAESELQRQGSNRISVQLPGIDPEDARNLVGRTALLEWRVWKEDASGNVAVLQPDGTEQFVAPANLPLDQSGRIDMENVVWVPATAEGSDGQEKELTGRFLQQNTYIRSNPITGAPEVIFQMTGEGSHLLEQITSEEIGKPLAFFLDGEPLRGEDGRILAPIVQSTITDTGVITGLNRADAHLLSIQVNAGALPVPLTTVQQEEVDATLGESAVKESVIAGEVAILLIMLFMILYYRLPGILAAAALFVYTSMVLAVFKIWPVTLTLSGVAAFVLSIGMAVDANILIFERMKEELRLGRSLTAAIDTGFSRAWPSIRDSNISTFITCGILIWFGDTLGTAQVEGFGFTLAIGVAVSMFSAITVTRTFLHVVVGTPFARRMGFFGADVVEARAILAEARPVAGGADAEAR